MIKNIFKLITITFLLIGCKSVEPIFDEEINQTNTKKTESSNKNKVKSKKISKK